jgi:hypothetical protein
MQEPWLVPKVVRDQKASMIRRVTVAFVWATLLPINLFFYVTIPDVR